MRDAGIRTDSAVVISSRWTFAADQCVFRLNEGIVRGKECCCLYAAILDCELRKAMDG